MVIIYDYIAGALGGICGLFISHPFDTIKVTLQLKTSKDKKPIIQTIKQVVKGGLKNGIYRGLGFPLCSNAVQNSVFFGTYGFVLSKLNKSQDGRSSPDGRNTSAEKNYLHVYIAGCMAGLAQVPVFCPPDRIKVVLQSQLNNFALIHDEGKNKTIHGSRPLSTNRQTIYFYGPREASLWLYQRYGWRGAFYRGFGCAILRDMNALSIYVVSYEFLRNQIYTRLGNSKKSEILSTLAGGAVAGSLSWITTMPLDVLKNVYQSDITHRKYKNPVHCARQLYQEYGLRVFYRGVVVVSLQALPVNAVIFLTYSQSLKAFHTWHYSNKMEEVTDIPIILEVNR